MKATGTQPRSRSDFARSTKWLCALFLFTVLPLLVFVTSVSIAGWKAVSGVLIGLLALLIFLVLAKRLPNRGNQRLREIVRFKLPGRDELTPEQFAERYYPQELRPVAVRLRQVLDSCMGVEISGLQPSDNFLQLLRLEPPSSLSWMDDPPEAAFFEEVATEFGLTFSDVDNWEAFQSFDSLLNYVTETTRRPPEEHCSKSVNPP